MKLTFLGTGTSQGVPVIGCRCKVCTSADRRDNRLRTSAMVETRGVRIVIDAGPDFRYQMLRTGVRHLDAILLTHEHKDHIGGLDDVRAFNFVDYPPTVHKVHIWAAPRALECVRKDFDYAFAQDKYRGVPEIELHEIDTARPFRVGDVEIVSVSGHHSERFEVTGFRIGTLAYLTDFKTIEDAEAEKLRGYGGAGGQCAAFRPASVAFQPRGGAGADPPRRAARGLYHAYVPRNRPACRDGGDAPAGRAPGLRRVGGGNLGSHSGRMR